MQGMYLAHRTGFHVDSNLREVVKHRSAHWSWNLIYIRLFP
jgi:hypothetical protein